ncbi:MAG: hypothetical protein WC554_02845 [Clostridia bacterium]
MIKTKKPTSNKSIKKKLDILWALLVKLKAGNKCEICGKTTNLNSHHIVSRHNLIFRWDIRNGCCLDVGCHKFKNESAHLDPIWFIGWIKENRKQDYEYLLANRNRLFDKDYERVESELKEELNNLQKGEVNER